MLSNTHMHLSLVGGTKEVQIFLCFSGFSNMKKERLAERKGKEGRSEIYGTPA